MTVHIDKNNQEWSNVSSAPNNLEFAFTICKYDKLSDKAFL